MIKPKKIARTGKGIHHEEYSNPLDLSLLISRCDLKISGRINQILVETVGDEQSHTQLPDVAAKDLLWMLKIY